MSIHHPQGPEIKAMKGIHLFYFGWSNCSMHVRIALAEKELSWESHVVAIGN